MTVLHRIRLALRRIGLEVNRYNPAQSSEARLLTLLARNGVDTIIDVGANDGGYALAMIGAGFKGRILSFEPLEDAHARLSEAAVRFDMWQIAPMMALGAIDGETEINVAGNSTSSSILPMRDRHQAAAPQSKFIRRQVVKIARLDGVEHPIFERGKSFHLKIDTQGFEMPVLMGATALLERTSSIQVELSFVPLYEGQAVYSEVMSWIEQQGFELCGVVPGFVESGTGRMLQMDGVFARPLRDARGGG